MLDVLFLLLIFFAATYSYRAAREQSIAMDLPVSQTAVDEPAARYDVRVNIDNDGRIIISGEPVTLDRLYEMLRDLSADYPDDRVIIGGDRSVAYGRVIAVMDAARAAGFSRVQLATVRTESQTGD
jgi:biopolymer transport protein ExbD